MVATALRSSFKPIVSTRQSARCQGPPRAKKGATSPGELLQHARPRRDSGGSQRPRIGGPAEDKGQVFAVERDRVYCERSRDQVNSAQGNADLEDYKKRLVDAKRVQNGQPHDNMANRALFYVPLEKGDAFAKSNSIPLNATSWRHRHIDKSWDQFGSTSAQTPGKTSALQRPESKASQQHRQPC